MTEIGLGEAPDERIWAHAAETRAVLLSKDDDFAQLARRSDRAAAVVWIRLGNTTSKALWQALAPVLPEIIEAVEQGERLIEVR